MKWQGRIQEFLKREVVRLYTLQTFYTMGVHGKRRRRKVLGGSGGISPGKIFPILLSKFYPLPSRFHETRKAFVKSTDIKSGVYLNSIIFMNHQK